MKKILMGITGGIAAYKMPETIRLLRQQGFEIKVVMTRAAEEFVTATTLEAVAGNPVHHSLWDESNMLHIELARWADMIVIAPATANCITKLAYGLADDLLSTICVTSTAPVIVAPAMNREMWANKATQANIQTLHLHGISIVGPADGEQACGEVGVGRMVEPHELVEFITLKATIQKHSLCGRNILITAGPTREAIDPIRYLSNRSTGKMGYALAQMAHDMGANVTLISGPTDLTPPNVTTILVETAREMHDVVMNALIFHDTFISAAAVADYTPVSVEPYKIKKSEGELTLRFKRTIDILAAVAALPERPYCVGFAAEDQDLLVRAKQKLQNKKVDMIVANDIDHSFGRDSNEVVIIKDDGSEIHLKKQSKAAIALQILEQLPQLLPV